VGLPTFNQIQNGMSYSAVVQLFGSPGTLSAESQVAGYQDQIYMWTKCCSAGANTEVTFQNGAVVSKAQFGLS
jgi:Domain of Unknown Function with PDB structure (DUF3862)